jgi:uncharacterized protein with FMN-binding domain
MNGYMKLHMRKYLLPFADSYAIFKYIYKRLPLRQLFYGESRMRNKKRLKIFLVVLGAFAAVIAGSIVFLSIGLDLKDALIKDIDISKVPDGTYARELEGSRFANTLEVTINGGEITGIRIVKDMTVATSGISDDLFAEVMENQSLQVDAVLGRHRIVEGLP